MKWEKSVPQIWLWTLIFLVILNFISEENVSLFSHSIPSPAQCLVHYRVSINRFWINESIREWVLGTRTLCSKDVLFFTYSFHFCKCIGRPDLLTYMIHSYLVLHQLFTYIFSSQSKSSGIWTRHRQPQIELNLEDLLKLKYSSCGRED